METRRGERRERGDEKTKSEKRGSEESYKAILF